MSYCGSLSSLSEGSELQICFSANIYEFVHIKSDVQTQCFPSVKHVAVLRITAGKNHILTCFEKNDMLDD